MGPIVIIYLRIQKIIILNLKIEWIQRLGKFFREFEILYIIQVKIKF